MHRTKSGILIPTHERRPCSKGRRRRYADGKLHIFEGIGAVVSPEGDILWQDEDWQLNFLADEGENAMLDVFLKETAVSTYPKYLCLIDGTTTAPVETSTMAYLGGGAGAQETKVPGNSGYNRQQIVGTTDWTNDGLISGDYRYSAAEKTFGAATATWTMNYAGVVTAATGQLAGSGKFLAAIPLSATTTIASGQSFKYILRWAQS